MIGKINSSNTLLLCSIKKDDHISIIAQNYDVAKAGKMLRASKKWREEHRMDYILQEFRVPEVLGPKYNPLGIYSESDHNLIIVLING